MKIVTLRKSGNSIIFPVPSDFNVSVGDEYTLSLKDDGSVEFTPVQHKNIFSTPEKKNCK